MQMMFGELQAQGDLKLTATRRLQRTYSAPIIPYTVPTERYDIATRVVGEGLHFNIGLPEADETLQGHSPSGGRAPMSWHTLDGVAGTPSPKSGDQGHKGSRTY